MKVRLLVLPVVVLLATLLFGRETTLRAEFTAMIGQDLAVVVDLNTGVQEVVRTDHQMQSLDFQNAMQFGDWTVSHTKGRVPYGGCPELYNANWILEIQNHNDGRKHEVLCAIQWDFNLP